MFAFPHPIPYSPLSIKMENDEPVKSLRTVKNKKNYFACISIIPLIKWRIVLR